MRAGVQDGGHDDDAVSSVTMIAFMREQGVPLLPDYLLRPRQLHPLLEVVGSWIAIEAWTAPQFLP